MEHVVNECGELSLKRSTYMEWLMINTYPSVPLIAIETGTLKGAWEKAIAGKLYMEIQNQNPMAFEILEQTGHKEYTKETFMAAGYLVTRSTPHK